MTIWGKFIGGFFGFLLTWGNPIGAVIGVLVGNLFDRGFKLNWETQRSSDQSEIQQQIQHAFFRATFLVMGHVAKVDGRVSEDEIRVARAIMNKMQLDNTQVSEAIALFKAGKQQDFNLSIALDDLLKFCRNQRNLLKMFLDIQYQAAMADGAPNFAKQEALGFICERLGFAPILNQYQRGYNYSRAQQESDNRQYQRENKSRHHSRQPPPKQKNPITVAFRLLEVSENASVGEIKKAYRKQMSQNHPDKLIAQGLPEEMIRLATDKTQQIQAAYEKIREARGF